MIIFRVPPRDAAGNFRRVDIRKHFSTHALLGGVLARQSHLVLFRRLRPDRRLILRLGFIRGLMFGPKLFQKLVVPDDPRVGAHVIRLRVPRPARAHLRIRRKIGITARLPDAHFLHPLEGAERRVGTPKSATRKHRELTSFRDDETVALGDFGAGRARAREGTARVRSRRRATARRARERTSDRRRGAHDAAKNEVGDVAHFHRLREARGARRDAGTRSRHERRHAGETFIHIITTRPKRVQNASKTAFVASRPLTVKS